MKDDRQEIPVQRLTRNCDCGGVVTVTIAHYQRVACRGCGRIYWALRPTHDLTLELRPWPGLHIGTPDQ